jgi:Protein of unknown function (DUF3465)
MKKIILALLVVAAGYWLQTNTNELKAERTSPAVESVPSTSPPDHDLLARAYEQQLSNLQVQGEGEVIKVLKDDTQGRNHQRFLLRLASGQTLLVAHNIDLAPRISSLREGDRVAFEGEYEWNDKGGVIHWTHRDPAGRHEDGWLEHNGRRYQ